MYLYYCVRTSASVIRNSGVVRYSGAATVLYIIIMETSLLHAHDSLAGALGPSRAVPTVSLRG